MNRRKGYESNAHRRDVQAVVACVIVVVALAVYGLADLLAERAALAVGALS
ncbi:hypothetical protein [Luteimonas saliphila]|uniref:hypothetical protein n=1 Tax=Luteimonas saliphila TaxID=2804919 RepID=UPI00192D7A78|nr:hypothetical protein [Luteimonas saliphila]